MGITWNVGDTAKELWREKDENEIFEKNVENLNLFFRNSVFIIVVVDKT